MAAPASLSKLTPSATTTQLSKPLPCTQGRLWGEERYSSGTLPTAYILPCTQDRLYTGEYSHTDNPSTGSGQAFGLMFYNARWYDPALGRFAQADTIIPHPYFPLSYDRFSYANNNPLRFNDPSGHCADDEGSFGADLICFYLPSLTEAKAFLDAINAIIYIHDYVEITVVEWLKETILGGAEDEATEYLVEKLGFSPGVAGWVATFISAGFDVADENAMKTLHSFRDDLAKSIETWESQDNSEKYHMNISIQSTSLGSDYWSIMVSRYVAEDNNDFTLFGSTEYIATEFGNTNPNAINGFGPYMKDLLVNQIGPEMNQTVTVVGWLTTTVYYPSGKWTWNWN